MSKVADQIIEDRELVREFRYLSGCECDLKLPLGEGERVTLRNAVNDFRKARRDRERRNG